MAYRTKELDLESLFNEEDQSSILEDLDRIQKTSNSKKLKSTVFIESDVPKTSIKSPFVIAFTDNLDYLAKILTKTEFRIVFYILSKMEYGNLISLKQSSISQVLDINKSNVSVSFKKLKEKSILVEDELGNIYFNSNIIIKGLPKKLTKDKRANLNKANKLNKDIKRSEY